MNALEGLTACAGNRRVTNTLQDPKAGHLEESPSTIRVTPILTGRFSRVDYTWGYRGRPQEGSLLVRLDSNDPDDQDELAADGVDSRA
jgi:hypothetical protein